ncbi:S8 family serine peptidase [Anaerotignum propionicum]|uniref:S8 family serine peptidase n=1 Tax=Anaerotignum propionicum TaxID=28446 RepID=UPI002109B72E|nr:S8 family serine peptidase [Anaerotignum propionicum]MCQ4936300.1 S8 family serine peptidase [Anaerotignum propionicum]
MRLMNKAVSFLLILSVLMGAFPSSIAYANQDIVASDFSQEKEDVSTHLGDKEKIIVKYKQLAEPSAVIADTEEKLANKESTIKQPDTSGTDSKLQLVAEVESLSLQVMEVDESIDIDDAIETLENNPEVEYVQPNYTFEELGFDSEPDFEQQWALNNKGQTINEDKGMAGVDLGVYSISDSMNAKDTVVVAVIDTGINVKHSEFKGRIVSGWDFYNDDASVFDKGDSSHGTGVAGVIAANIDHNGIAGIAQNAKIMPLKFMENGEGYTFDVIRAIEYAKERGVKIINCSFGSREYNPALMEVMAENRDILFVCAAGNNGDSTKIYPAAFDLPNVISVGSINNKGELASKSNYGKTVHIAAPGENIYTTKNENDYGFVSGTSMAGAYISGVAALYSGKYPDVSAENISLALKSSGVQLDDINGKTLFGLVQLSNLLDASDLEAENGNDLNLPFEVQSLINGSRLYTDLTNDEKEQLLSNLEVEDSNMVLCSNVGISLKESISLARIMGLVNIDLDSAKKMISNFSSDKDALLQAKLYDQYMQKISADNNEDIELFKELLCSGYKTKSILTSYLVAKTFEIDMNTIIQKQNGIGNPVEDEIGTFSEMAMFYSVNEEVLIAISRVNGITLVEMLQMIQDKKDELHISFEEELQALTETEEDTNDAVQALPNAPFQYKAGINENVNLNTGALTYEDTLVSLPGRNGMDLNLVMKYNSAESYSADKTTVYPQKYLGKGWSLNFTKILTVDDQQFVRFSDGSTYRIISGKLENYKLQDVTLVHKNKEYELDYADGRKEAFDSMGNISLMEDRFGNQISFKKQGAQSVIITDSVGKETKIYYSSDENRLYQIILPDRSVISLYLDANGNLIKKEDQVGRITEYKYSSQEGEFYGSSRKYSNLTSVQYPTGLKGFYEYELVNIKIAANIYSKYYRIKNTYKKEGMVNYLSSTYEYNGSYMNAESNYSTTVTNAYGTKINTVFDFKSGNKTSEKVTVDGVIAKEVVYTYNANDLPVNINTNVYKSAVAGKHFIELYTYDDKGNVLTYINPLGEGDSNSSAYKTTYTYDHLFNLITSTSVQKDDDTVVKQEASLTGNRKSIRELRTYENSQLKVYSKFGYDDYGNILNLYQNKTEDDCITQRYTYEDGAYLSSQTIGDHTINYTYDKLGRVASVTDAIGNTTKYQYDDLGRKLKTINADGTSQDCTYNDTDNCLIITDENGYKKRYEYDSFGNIIKVVDLTTDCVISKSTYDQLLRLKEQYDGNKIKTEYTYDYLNRPLTVLKGDYQETYEYDDTFSLKTSREIKSIKGDKNAPDSTAFKDKDYLGNVIKSGYLSNSNEIGVTNYTYDYLGHMVSKVTTKDQLEGYQYTCKYETDYAGNVLSVTYSDGITIKSKYDMLGRKIQDQDAMGNLSNYEYNDIGNIIKTDRAFDSRNVSIEKNQYDLNGNLIKLSISSSKPNSELEFQNTDYEYDDCNRLIQTTSYDGNQSICTEYSYDGLGNRVMMKTGNGTSTWKYEYDSQGRLKQYTDALGQSESYQYDGNGNIIGKTDRNGNETTNTYNELNLLVSTSVETQQGETKTIGYSYSPSGMKTKETNENLTTEYKYDCRGMVIREKNDQGQEKQYLYDDLGNKTSFKLISNRTLELNLSYQYDTLNRLQAVLENGQKKASYQYDRMGNLISEVYDNGIVVSYLYNAANLMTSIKSEINGGLISGYDYSYSLDGNQIAKNDLRGEHVEYVYDGIGRLKEEDTTSKNGTNEICTYDYDANGNRILKLVSGDENAKTTYEYDKNNRLISEETKKADSEYPIDVTEYYYDKNGNQVSKLSGTIDSLEGQVSSVGIGESGSLYQYELFQYDGWNHLAKYETDGTTAQYTYAPNGLRMSKEVNGEMTSHVWDGSNIVLELYTTGNVKNKYIRGKSLIKTADDIYYIHDGHGDITQLANRNGDIIQDYEYDAFGVETTEEVSDATAQYNPFRYCGEYFDEELGYIYLRARYYEPKNGRMITEDPIQAGANWYIYCENNPNKLVDPSGLIPTAVEAADMAEQIYNVTVDDIGNASVSGGWILVDIKTGGDNMKMGVYSREKSDGTTEYALVNKGTTLKSGSDWKNNAQQLFGSSDDMKASIKKSNDFVDNHLDYEITMVGHSKGGAEAAANAVARNKSSIIFNPATVNLGKYGLKASGYDASMTAFIVKGDILNSTEGWFSKSIDKRVYLPQQYGGRWHQLWQTNVVQGVKNHLMGAVKEALKEAGY